MEPFADVITLLRPRAIGTKVIEGAGRWAVRRSRMNLAGFGLVLIGECWITVDGHKPVRLAKGDFVLLPADPGFTIASDLACESRLDRHGRGVALSGRRGPIRRSRSRAGVQAARWQFRTRLGQPRAARRTAPDSCPYPGLRSRCGTT